MFYSFSRLCLYSLRKGDCCLLGNAVFKRTVNVLPNHTTFLQCNFKYETNHSKTNTGRKSSYSTSLALKSDNDHSSGRDVITKIDNQLSGQSIGRLFAVVHIAGKQRKITADDIIVLDKPIEADIGDKIVLNKVLLVGGKDFTLIGRPVLNSDIVKVEASVLEKTLSHTVICSWYHKRQDHRRLYLQKHLLTYLRIENILINKS